MTDKASPATPRVPQPEEIKEFLGFVPLLAAYFQRARIDMPVELQETFRSNRLTARHGAILAQLVAQQLISVTDLARRLGLSLSTTSELVGDLSRAGLVERQEDPANRRRTLVSLSEQHRPVFEAFVAARAAPLLRVLESLSPRDREGFAAGLAAWAAEVRNWTDAGP